MAEKMDRRAFLEFAAVTGAFAASVPVKRPKMRNGRTSAAPELDEITVADLQQSMASGQFTSRAVTEAYIQRINDTNSQGPMLRAVLEINPDALTIADTLDAERKAGKVRGPLHGIPVLIKDNIATRDRMQTTAGSLALIGVNPPRDSFVASRLRDAGAIIMGKTNLSEWANFRSTHASSGWTGRGGQCRNPYALDRSPSGSSSGSGSATSANLCAISVGTETDGSVVSPSTNCSLVGIKPTVGLISRAGIIPISHSQDTAGPMTRTVADAAALLGALTGLDPRDRATAASKGKAESDYSRFLDAGGLKGARLGVCRAHFMGYSRRTDDLIEEAITALRAQGAIIVDPADIPTAGKFDDDEYTVLVYEFKADLNAYLAEYAADGPAKTLADLIAFNDQQKGSELQYFGQEIFQQAEAKGPLTDPRYLKALRRCRLLSRTEGVDLVMRKHRLDALIAPTGGPPSLIDLVNGDPSGGGSFSTPAAVSGYPHITVPAGYVLGLPVGLSFMGQPWTEGKLIKYAYAFEQATKARKAPRFLPTAPVEMVTK